MNLPTEKECYELLEEYHVPAHVIRHSEQVRAVALFLGRKLKENGIDIDLDALNSAALLHDLMRTVDFSDIPSQSSESDIHAWERIKDRYPGKRHGEAAYEFFKGKYPEMALIIRKHTFSAVDSDDEMKRPITWEEKVLNYADKRVAHDKLVTMDERFTEGDKRWHTEHPHENHDPEYIKRVRKKHYATEKEIFNIIGLDPDRLEDYMEVE